MKEERDYHIANKQENIKSKDAMKKDYDTVDKAQTFEITEKSGEHKDKVEKLNVALDHNREDLIRKYEDKYQRLKEELELRLKVEIHEIEERKN